MNKENLRILAHELRADPDSYDQATFGRVSRCGSVACIAGHAEVLATGRKIGHRKRTARIAAKWLDLTVYEEGKLFQPHPHDEDWPDEGWPEPFGKRWCEAAFFDGAEAPAHVAADLLDALADGKVSL